MFQQDPIGNQGSKENKWTQTTPSNPGGVVNPPTKGAAPEGFGWKALDYKFGDKPLYQVTKSLLKNKTSTGSFCGGQPTGAGGMSNPAAAAALNGGGSDNPYAPNATPNPDPISPQEEIPETGDWGGELG